MKLTINQVLALVKKRLEEESVSLVRQGAIRKLAQLGQSVQHLGNKEIELKPQMSEEAEELLKAPKALGGSKSGPAGDAPKGTKKK